MPFTAYIGEAGDEGLGNGSPLLYEESETEPPKWHEDILEARKSKIETGKAEFLTIEELKASLRHEKNQIFGIVNRNTLP